MRYTDIIRFCYLFSLFVYASAGNYRGKYSHCQLEWKQRIAGIKLLILPVGIFDQADRVPNYQEYITNFMIHSTDDRLYDLTFGTGKLYELPLHAVQVDDPLYTKHSLAHPLQAKAAFVFQKDSFVSMDRNRRDLMTFMFYNGQTKEELTDGAPSGNVVMISPRLDQVTVYIKNDTRSEGTIYHECSINQRKFTCTAKTIRGRQGPRESDSSPLFVIQNSLPEMYFVLYQEGTYEIHLNLSSILLNRKAYFKGTISHVSLIGCEITPPPPGTKEALEPSVWTWIIPILIIVVIFVLWIASGQLCK